MKATQRISIRGIGRAPHVIRERPRCVWPECEGECFRDFPLCATHVHGVYRKVADAIARPEIRFGPTRPPRVTGTPGLVYFMQFGPNAKIGFTTNLPSRIKSLRPDRVLGVMDGTTKEERALHAKFGPYWVDGEYFELTSDILEYIESNTRAA